MNSSLQILIHNEIFLNQISLIKINPFMNEIMNEFLEILFAILNYKYNEDNNYLINSYSPIKFKNYFIENHQNFKEGQQDEIEFLRVLLDNISMETNRNKVKVEYKELNLEDKSKKIQNDEYHKYYLSREDSIITDLFYIQIINIFTCKCGKETYSFQKLLDIPLLIPREAKESKLEDLLFNFLNTINVSLKEKCKDCNKNKTNIEKHMTLGVLNDIVIFSLQRLDPLLSVKSNTRIYFPDIIDLKLFADELIQNDNLKYRLFGTIHHNGSIQYGHYYSLIKIKNEWFEFNDSLVTKKEIMEYNSNNVCILFYEKIKFN